MHIMVGTKKLYYNRVNWPLTSYSPTYSNTVDLSSQKYAIKLSDALVATIG
jgi:hypothetical protein